MLTLIKKTPITFAIFLSLLYWSCLLLTSTMSISYDAISYERLGTTIYRQGWIKYFQTGPNREILYPLLISVAMRLADFLGISYTKVQAVFQIFILLATQVLALKLLRKLNISETINAFVLLFIGLSPALVNSTFSLFSEILTYPVVLGILLCLSQAWKAVKNNSPIKSGIMGIFLGLLFILAVASKAIFIYTLPLCLLPFLVLGIYSLFKKRPKVFVNAVIVISVAFLSMQAFVCVIKGLNLKYNGSYQYTDRGAWFLYGCSAAKTQKKLTPKEFLTALAMVPGKGICQIFFEPAECDYFSPATADLLGGEKDNKLRAQGISARELDATLIKLSAQQIMERPFQYTILYLMESLKIFFWESTSIGYVQYPDILTGIFAFTPFKNGIRLLVSLLSLIGFLYVFIYVMKRKSALLFNSDGNNEKAALGLFMILFCVGYIALYSLFAVIPRYGFPLAPIFILCAALLLQRWIKPQ